MVNDLYLNMMEKISLLCVNDHVSCDFYHFTEKKTNQKV